MADERSSIEDRSEPDTFGGLFYGLTCVVALVALVVGLVMAVCSGYHDIGLGLLVVGLPVLVASAVGLFDSSTAGPGPRTGAILVSVATVVVLFVSLTAGLAAVAGQAVRWLDPADYYGWYGTRVTTNLPNECEISDYTDHTGGAPRMRHDVVCEHATWRLDGRPHEGTITIFWTEVGQHGSANVPKTDEAFVIGDRGYSVTNVGDVGRFGRWGAVPLWLLAGLPVAAVVLALVAWSRRRRGTTRGVDPAQAAAVGSPQSER